MRSIQTVVGRLLRGTADVIFGYDFFISYAHADGHDYPRSLRESLESRGYKVFQDKVGFVGGEDLNFATRRRIRMSSNFVLLARPAAVSQSKWVRREVELFIEKGRDPIIVEFGEVISTLSADAPMARLLPGDRLTFREQADERQPTEGVFNDIVWSFTGTRQEARRLRALLAATLSFLLLAAVATWQWYEAESQRRISDAMALDAMAGQHFAEAARILAVWDREWGRQLELESDLVRFSSDTALNDAERALRIENLRYEIGEIAVSRDRRSLAARDERAIARQLLGKAEASWGYAEAFNGAAREHRQKPDAPSLFAIEVLGVGYGESVILHYGDPDAPHFVLIDGGRPASYKRSLVARLASLKSKWSPQDALKLEYAIVSNQDYDRLGGLVSLLKDLRQARLTRGATGFDLKNMWYVSFGPGFKGNLAAQARLLIDELRIPLNKPFPNVVMRPRNGTATIDLGYGLSVTVLSPTFDEVVDLYDSWVERSHGKQRLVAPTEQFDNVPGVTVSSNSKPDPNGDKCPRGKETASNRASLALLFRYRTTTFLHGGDACSPQIEAGLRAAGLTAADGTFHVDVMLLPRKGYAQNNTEGFLRRIKADHYLFTGEGKFGSPELPTLEAIIKARRGETYTFEFVNRDGTEGHGRELDQLLSRWPAHEYGYLRVFRPSMRNALTVDVLDRLRY